MNETLFLEDTEIIVFRVGDITIGLPITEVREIFKSPTITPVHTAFSYVNGVINLRGSIVTIIDLSKRMDLPIKQNTKAVHIVLVEFGEELIGLLVDGIEERWQLSPANDNPLLPYAAALPHHEGTTIITPHQHGGPVPPTAPQPADSIQM